MRPEEVNSYRKLNREKAEKNIDEYAMKAKRGREDLEVQFPSPVNAFFTSLVNELASNNFPHGNV